MNPSRSRLILLLGGLFLLSLALPFWMTGVNNKNSLFRKQSAAISAFEKYLAVQKQVVSYVLSDNMVKSSLVQFYLGSGLGMLQNHLADLQKNFPDVKIITLFDRSGRHYLSTDYTESADLTAMELMRLDKPFYNISYARSYNQYVFIITVPLMNDFNFRIGYLRLEFSMESLVASMGVSSDLAVFIRKGIHPVFSAPATLQVTEFPHDEFSGTQGVSAVTYDGQKYLSISTYHPATGFDILFLYRQLNRAFFIIIGGNALLFVLLVIFLVRYVVRRRETEEGKKMKSETDDLLNYSQLALRNVYLINELVDEVGHQKAELREKLKGLNVTREGTGTSRMPNDFKIIEPF